MSTAAGSVDADSPMTSPAPGHATVRMSFPSCAAVTGASCAVASVTRIAGRLGRTAPSAPRGPKSFGLSSGSCTGIDGPDRGAVIVALMPKAPAVVTGALRVVRWSG